MWAVFVGKPSAGLVFFVCYNGPGTERSGMKYILALALAFALPAAAPAVTIDLVSVGNPGNAGEIIPGIGILGAVSTAYRIGKTEVTNSQYVEFLNAKAATDALGLYNTSMGLNIDGGIVRSGTSGSYTYAVKATATGAGPGGADYTYSDKPVAYVSWYDAIRFANWMHNGQGSGSTETGAYTIMGGTQIPTNPDSITRNASATWFLPSENQWYKAAYYNGATSTYFDYPTASDTAPDNHLPTADTGNSANYLIGPLTTTGDLDHPLTSVGSYVMSESAYGTFDQAGNLAEWNEALVSAGRRGRRGGAWSTTATYLSSVTRDNQSAFSENNSTGFRLATIAAVVNVPGDYSGNGVVDAADYIIWRQHLGTNFQLANEVAGASPGEVTQADFTEWRARFGNTSGSGAGTLAASAGVPEPGLLGLGSVALLVAGLARRRVRHTHR
jgi:formylglycine-generating enzyme required for sulfatase activity